MMRPDGLLKIMALACFISAIPVAGRSADNLLQDCALGKKDTARSIAACTSIILNTASAATRRANALVNRGTAYQQLNDARQSIADFSDAITLQPQLAFPWQSRGEAYLQFRDYKNAISDITNAIRIDPKWAFRYHSRANAYREIGDLDRALADYSTAISIDRTHDFRFGDRAGVYISLGKWQLALADLDEASTLNPKFAALYWRKAQAYLALFNPARALEESSRAVNLDPKDAEAYLYRAIAHEKLGETEAAKGDYQTVLALRPGDVAATAALANLNPPVAKPPVFQSVIPAPDMSALKGASCGALGKRVALVIGNSAYPGAASLTNPANDADDVAAILRNKLCFTVIEAKNATLEVFTSKISEFAAAADGANVALFYYAGHGMQFEQTNYLLPVDTKMTNEYEAIHGNISAQDVLALLEPRTKFLLAFLDACRNNPIEDDFKRRVAAVGRSFGDTRGLGPMSPRNSETLIVFATRLNERAADGTGRNSPFTEAFLQNIATAGKDIDVVMRAVTVAVDEKTKGVQIPERLTRLRHELILLPTP